MRSGLVATVRLAVALALAVAGPVSCGTDVVDLGSGAAKGSPGDAGALPPADLGHARCTTMENATRRCRICAVPGHDALRTACADLRCRPLDPRCKSCIWTDAPRRPCKICPGFDTCHRKPKP